MNKLGQLRAEIRQKFLSSVVITTYAYYSQLDTAVLLALQEGFERDYDAACAGDPYRQPLEWLIERISIVTRVLDDREAGQRATSAERMYNRVEAGQATKVVKWNKPNITHAKS
jgi:phosphoenolpyruvate carboxylase